MPSLALCEDSECKRELEGSRFWQNKEKQNHRLLLGREHKAREEYDRAAE